MSIAHAALSSRRRQRLAAVPFAELLVAHVRSGSKRVGEGARQAEIPAGSYLCVLPGSLLNVENLPPADGPYSASCLSIAPAWLQAEAPPASGTARRWARLDATPVLDQAFAHAERGLREGLPEAVLRHRVRELLEALRLAGFVPAAPAAAGVVERVRLLLAGTPARAWRAEEIAVGMAMSMATLRRRLAAEGSTFRAILEEVRLAHALSLVQGGRQPLKQVAMACGYQSPSRFAARFRQRFGTRPSELRA
ncbi:MAG TPA: helix-turn-helix transcriptional regulator [Frateuria sp.]|uniref:helix-turn-helix transcriptional regulator n=1 Tax=Frateuria sp. TaxID=2211372 RepID=UPI002D7E96F2|nr:helix-turn-helix transcriptional regulator [Frateuria sp.]HET6806071.1 helix-turn-helix transcriptional regulator [Frateuria sp.]